MDAYIVWYCLVYNVTPAVARALLAASRFTLDSNRHQVHSNVCKGCADPGTRN